MDAQNIFMNEIEKLAGTLPIGRQLRTAGPAVRKSYLPLLREIREGYIGRSRKPGAAPWYAETKGEDLEKLRSQLSRHLSK